MKEKNNMNNFVKQAYVQGLAARAILRARMMSKQAGGVDGYINAATQAIKGKNPGSVGAYALSGGIGAGSGALIGALVNYARKKSLLQGALVGGGLGGLAGLGYQGLKHHAFNKNTAGTLLETLPITSSDGSGSAQNLMVMSNGYVPALGIHVDPSLANEAPTNPTNGPLSDAGATYTLDNGYNPATGQIITPDQTVTMSNGTPVIRDR